MGERAFSQIEPNDNIDWSLLPSHVTTTRQTKNYHPTYRLLFCWSSNIPSLDGARKNLTYNETGWPAFRELPHPTPLKSNGGVRMSVDPPSH